MPGSVLGKLRVRLILLTLLALFPLGIIALGQAIQTADQNRERNQQALLDATNVAAASQSARIKQAIGAGQGLATIALVTDTATCRQGMSQFLANNPTYAFAGFIPISGVMTCSSSGDLTVDFSDFPSWQRALAKADVFVEVNTDGAVSGKPVVIVNVPVLDAGSLIGFVSLSLPQDVINTPSSDPENTSLVALATSGNAFAMSTQTGKAEMYLPRDMTMDEITARAGDIFFASDASGESRAFTVTERIADSFVIVGSWPRSVLFGRDQWQQALTPVLFAVLMWSASISVASFGLDRLVLRHLRALRSAMRRFALGERNAEGLALHNAPDEFKDAERAFNRMAMLITEAEAARLTDLHDKEVLLREVHHRVKNNLQMIASIMNLQARGARTDDVRDVLASLQRRVRGLAMLHQSLYTQSETSQVDASDVVAAVVADSSALLPDSSLRIETELSSARLYPDQAVPLSMWVTEALTNAVKYVGRTKTGQVQISVTMTHDESGQVALHVENTKGTPLVPNAGKVESTGLGTKLMTAFCRQLEGEIETEDTAERYSHILRFRVQGFEPEVAEDAPDRQRATPDVAA